MRPCPLERGTSTRQKLNTKSSTEAELVGVSDILPQVLSTRYFLQAQGYGITENIVYQDNKSAIKLESNGRGSSGKRTRHIYVRYFFIADRIINKEVRVAYCPASDMVADFFYQTINGVYFQKLCAMSPKHPKKLWSCQHCTCSRATGVCWGWMTDQAS